MKSRSDCSRRNFVVGTAGIAAWVSGGCLSSARKTKLCGEKVRLAAAGVWGKGFSDWLPMVQTGHAELVAICDCDRAMLDLAMAALKERGIALPFDLSRVPFYTDYRQMLDDADRLGIEAITVSTPDHAHAPIAIRAMKQGIHAYVQKPLVRTLWELDYFGKVARESGVVTQMGNQGSSGASFRRGVEILQSGILGDVREIHVWTNRPVWPQGDWAKKLLARPDEPPPASLNWDAWLGTAAMRPYKGNRGPDSRDYAWCTKMGLTSVYHQFNWRGFADFGTGALGDMACHLMNLPFRGVELGTVTRATCGRISENHGGIYPASSIVEIDFATRTVNGRNLPAVKMYWYEGGLKSSADITAPMSDIFKDVPIGGCVVVGAKGSLYSTDSYGQTSFVKMSGEKKMRSIFKHEACLAVPETLPRRAEKGVDGNYVEFVDAVRGIGPTFAATHSRCYGDTEHSIPLMEGMLVACAAQQLPGQTLAWDSAAQKFDVAAANALVKPYIRKGWAF